MTNYVLGIIFDTSLKRVLLIHKKTSGKIEGIGGKIVAKETAKQALVRVIHETTNLLFQKKELIHLGTQKHTKWQIELFTTVYTQNNKDAKTMTDEPIQWVSIHRLPTTLVSSITWLIPLCLDRLKNKSPQKVQITY